MTKLLGLNKKEWEENGGLFTAEEIAQQPEMWKLTYKRIKEIKKELLTYYRKLLKEDNLKIIFAGAGSSGFIGDSLETYIKKKLPHVEIFSAHTTDIVTHPDVYFEKDVPTLLISFGRSGNSPESIAAIELAEKMIDDIYHLGITCNKNGKLANNISAPNGKLILLPEKTHDRGFAMTSSFTSMMLATILFFNIEELENMASVIEAKINSAKSIINNFGNNQKFLKTDFKKIIYLGGYGYYGIAKEASLKLLELTSGKIVTRYDSPLGFRHGPKSIIDENSLIVFLLSDDKYSLKYEYDLLNELNNGKSDYKTAVISNKERKKFKEKSDYYYTSNITDYNFDEIVNVLDYIIYAQIISLYKSIQNGINPDDPSPSGSVNRVVQGVKIHPYQK